MSPVWWPVILALGRLKQEDQALVVILHYRVSLWPAWTIALPLPPPHPITEKDAVVLGKCSVLKVRPEFRSPLPTSEVIPVLGE